MRLPNKIFSYQESVLSKFATILAAIKRQPLSVSSLYIVVKGEVEDISEFLEILDSLFALGQIAYDEKVGVLCYVA